MRERERERVEAGTMEEKERKKGINKWGRNFANRKVKSSGSRVAVSYVLRETAVIILFIYFFYLLNAVKVISNTFFYLSTSIITVFL